jgi:phage terminase large subunit GpA-like protein
MVDDIPTGPAAGELMAFNIKCPRCGKYTQKMVAWLASHHALTCATPDCGSINLDEPHQRALIEKLVQQAAELRPLMVAPTKRD